MTAPVGRSQSVRCGALHPGSDTTWAIYCTLPTQHEGDHALTWPSDAASGPTP